MGCLKCGRETVSEQVFCPECQEIMKQYPVRPGTVVQLPSRKKETAVKKQTKKRVYTPEEQLKGLRRLVRVLLVTTVLLLVTSIVFAVPAVEHWSENHFKIGQNYSTVTVPAETE